MTYLILIIHIFVTLFITIIDAEISIVTDFTLEKLMVRIKFKIKLS